MIADLVLEFIHCEPDMPVRLSKARGKGLIEIKRIISSLVATIELSCFSKALDQSKIRTSETMDQKSRSVIKTESIFTKTSLLGKCWHFYPPSFNN